MDMSVKSAQKKGWKNKIVPNLTKEEGMKNRAVPCSGPSRCSIVIATVWKLFYSAVFTEQFWQVTGLEEVEDHLGTGLRNSKQGKSIKPSMVTDKALQIQLNLENWTIVL